MVTPVGFGVVPHVGGPVLPQITMTVLIGGLPAATVGSSAACVGAHDTIIAGSHTVIVGGLPAARTGDQTAHGGQVVGGEPTVLIGG